jgi:protein gp37
VADRSAIEWTRGADGSPGATWNPVRGCTKISAGCKNCYAERFAERWRGVPGHPFEQGFDVRLVPGALELPLRWRKPRNVFVNSMSDLFHEDVPFEFVDRVFAVMALSYWHTFQVLTKRPARMREYLSHTRGERNVLVRVLNHARELEKPRGYVHPDGLGWPYRNVWLGVSVEDQRAADERIPELLATPAAVRFLSCEPLLGPVDLSKWFGGPGSPVRVDNPGPTVEPRTVGGGHARSEPSGSVTGNVAEPQLDPAGAAASRTRPSTSWVIVGGESGPGARPMHPAWARSLRDQCVAAGVPFFFKQWGAWGDFTTATPKPSAIEDRIFTADGEVLGAGGGRGAQARGMVEVGWEARGAAWMSRVRKKRAGRELDGRTWDEMPEVTPCR